MLYSFRKKYSWDIYDCTNRRGSGRVLLGFRQLFHKTSLVEADHQRVSRG